MNTPRTPDRATRLISHAVVGGAAALIIRRVLPQANVITQVAGILLAAGLHEELDAPVANWIAANTDL